jgi:hypothetical protein
VKPRARDIDVTLHDRDAPAALGARVCTRGLVGSAPVVRQRSGVLRRRLAITVLVGSWSAPACIPAPVIDNSGASTSSGDTSTTSTSGESSTSSGALPQAPACVKYLGCLAQVAQPEVVAAGEAMYGADAQCWTSSERAAECADECIALADEQCGGSSGSETGEAPPKCAIESLEPGAPNPIVAGTASGELPIDVGDLLARNCGCHYVDDAALAREVPAYLGAMPMATWQDFHTPFNGVLVRDRVADRAVVQLSMPPPFYCDALAFGSLSAEDHALLQQWLAAGAPDGASWP